MFAMRRSLYTTSSELVKQRSCINYKSFCHKWLFTLMFFCFVLFWGRDLLNDSKSNKLVSRCVCFVKYLFYYNSNKEVRTCPSCKTCNLLAFWSRQKENLRAGGPKWVFAPFFVFSPFLHSYYSPSLLQIQPKKSPFCSVDFWQDL
jgi:hypothetical protein